ncbi:MAG: threonine--tRNA ligase [Myxococcales bacterium]|nr:threonine--tRNA ligase [Myxococcales bacterium]
MSARLPLRDLLREKGLLSREVIAADVGGRVVDLHTPVDADATATPITVTDPRGLAIIRHSTAHVMADAVQRLFPGTKVTIGPAIEDGFYYDFDRVDGNFTDDDLAKIEKAMRDLIKNPSPFKREVVTREQALEMFEKMGESFKVEIIRAIPEGEEISLYSHGAEGSTWVDVCEGPHVPTTSYLKAVKLTHVAGAYWRGDERNPMLQRIYGTAFPTKEALEEHLRLVEEARARDHRKLGKELDLFMFDAVAPAMPFFLPRGTFVYNALVGYVRDLYRVYGYDEVITPLAYSPELFKKSGHLENYADNMYRLWTEDEWDKVDEEADHRGGVTGAHEGLAAHSFCLKPMNCPSHCVIFGSRRRSYRELPWRVADFARLHRYERGGVVHGLARVRSFAQDDAHIFCSIDQVPDEISSFISMLYEVYQSLSFVRVDVKLATRPAQRIGTDEEWDRAEKALAEGLEKAGLAFEYAPGEGAFYGPKVEFHVLDALKRSWQLGTIQYDPNLPERFDLSYIGEDGKEHRPVMLHRAVLGSLERFFAVYLEHCGGNFPLWLSPTQAVVLSVSEKSEDYARKVTDELREAGVRVEADLSADKLGAKIRNARLMRQPYMLVIGAKEAEDGTVGVRSRDKGELGAMSVADVTKLLLEEGRSPKAGHRKGVAAPATS